MVVVVRVLEIGGGNGGDGGDVDADNNRMC